MRRQNRPANFRISDRLLAAAKAKARQNGTTVSAMIRAALERETGIAA